MEFPLPIAGCEGQNLVVKCPLGSGFQLWQNGSLLQAQKRKYMIKNNAGHPVAIHFKVNFRDIAVPKILVNDQPVEITPPLSWYDQVLVHLPVVLLLVGGAVGGLIGVAAAMLNGRLYHSVPGKAVRYGAMVLVFIGAVAAYMFIAYWIQTRLINPNI